MDNKIALWACKKVFFNTKRENHVEHVASWNLKEVLLLHTTKKQLFEVGKNYWPF
jgi:hypothetical protein